MDAVGIVGLGLMGSALAERLRGASIELVGYDPRPECRDQLRELGGRPARSSREVFENARIVLLSLPTSEVVVQVVAEASDLLGGATILDTTTGDPEATGELGRRLSERGCDYLDATLTGSSAEARAGQVVVTAGGTADAFARAVPVFRLFASRWFHVGAWGSGARTKLVVNLVLGLNRAVLAEGLAFARDCGLDLDAILEVLRSGAAYSRAMDTKGRKMIDGDFTPQAKLEQHLKDVRLILAAGGRSGAQLPFSHVHERLLAELAGRGLGDRDNSAIVRAFERQGDA